MVGLAEVVASDGIEPSLTGPKAVVLTVIRQGGKAGAGRVRMLQSPPLYGDACAPACGS